MTLQLTSRFLEDEAKGTFEGEGNVWCVNMLKRSFLLFFGMCIVTCFVPAAPPHHAEDEKRPVTVEDSIRMTKLGDSYYYNGDLSFFGDGGASTRTRVAKFSPDGKKFTICLRKGNLQENTNEFSLLLYKTDEVFALPTAEVIVTMASSSNLDAIESVTWLGDNETMAFLGAPGNDVRQVYTYNIRRHKLTKMTSSSTNVISFGISSSGDRVAFVAEKPADSVWDEHAEKHGVIVSTQYSIFDLIQGHTEQSLASGLFVKSASNSGSRPIGRNLTFWGAPFLSPDGKYIVIANQPTNIPAEWKEYSDASLRSFAKVKRRPGEPSFFRRYQLIDADSGESWILVDSPVGSMRSNKEVVWSSDSKSVAISGLYLPLDKTDGLERETRRNSMFAVVMGVPSCQFEKVSQGDSVIKEWNGKTNDLILAGGRDRPGQIFAFQKKNGAWEEIKDRIAEDSRPEIVLQEDMNHPPKIYAISASDGRRALLLDLNPQFKALRFAIEEEIHWKTSDGHDVKGGLYYPVDYVPGKKYPLVIQTHGFLPDKFGIDGAYVAPFAAQPMAAKGMVVLQADQDYGKMDSTPGEVDREVDRIESAIDYLDRKGLIDSARVGVIGFSQTCLYVTYALTHSKYHFAAASIMDGFDAGYVEHIISAPKFAWKVAAGDGINGGPPFGATMKMWLQRSPGFNTYNVRTPLRIIALNLGSLLGEWEWFAALSVQNKPVEMVYLHNAVHVLERPWDRMVVQQGTVDWFAFWLKGEEDADPTKTEQLARWRELRKLQQRNGMDSFPADSAR